MSPKGASGAKPITSSAFYILLALADEDRHGLGIADEVARRTGNDVDLGPARSTTPSRRRWKAG